MTYEPILKVSIISHILGPSGGYTLIDVAEKQPLR